MAGNEIGPTDPSLDPEVLRRRLRKKLYGYTPEGDGGIDPCAMRRLNATQNRELLFDVIDEDSYFYVFVKVGHDRVGELKAEKLDEGRARLSDIRIKDDWLRRRTWVERLRSRPFVKIESCSFQGVGIGSELLAAFFAWCCRQNIDHVYGSVVASDLNQTPALLDWYRKRGFRIEEPSKECLPMAVKMVVWNRNDPSLNR